MKRQFVLLLTIGLVMALASTASAVILTNGNSTYTVGPSGNFNAFSWNVDGQTQLFEQSFHFRVGGIGPEANLGTLANVENIINPDIVEYTYTAATWHAVVRYSLVGGAAGSGQSDIAEQISIFNDTGSALDMHFFQYSDFDLGGTSTQDKLWFTNSATVRQMDTLGSNVLSETVVSPPPSHYEGSDTFSGANSVRNKLADASATTLNDLPGLGNVIQGDMEWGFQWDVSIAGNSSFLISKDKNLTIVPEPATLLLLGGSLLAVGFAQRRRKKA